MEVSGHTTAHYAVAFNFSLKFNYTTEEKNNETLIIVDWWAFEGTKVNWRKKEAALGHSSFSKKTN